MDMPERPVLARKNGSKSPNGQQKPDGDKSQNPTKKVDPFSEGHDFLILNSPIEDGVFTRVMSCTTKRENKTNKRLVLALVTYGGAADVAYRVGRFLQSVYEDITVFVPSSCKSAGTLLALAANKIVMSPFGELGPLDVQLRVKDEIFGRRSGLTTRAAITDLQSHTFDLFEHFMLNIIRNSYGNVSFKVAADISARTTGVL